MRPVLISAYIILAFLFAVWPRQTIATSLYSTEDPIEQLLASNFGQKITGAENAWLIEFYAVWCGHCQRFAKIYKELANYVKDWGKVIKVGAVACSDPVNAALCRRTQIWGYPTLKFYAPHSGQHVRGHTYVGALTLDALRRRVVEYVRSWPDRPASWPVFEPARDTRSILETAPRGTSTILVIIEMPSNPQLGTELLLDLSSWPEVYGRRMVQADAPPGVSLLARDGSLTNIIKGTDRDLLRSTITRYLRRDTPNLPVTQRAPEQTTPTVVNSATSTHGLHMQDLESGLYYSLWLEVGSYTNISGPALASLKAYIDILYKYFPGNHYIMNFLEKIRLWLAGIHTSISAKQWIDEISALQTEGSHLPDRLRWTGCAGSRPQFRGYPCSLWKTFHALTVNALEYSSMDRARAYTPILPHIVDYVRYFLGCRDCADHFLAMARSLQSEVHSPADEVLWLWRAHNKVNLRLAADETEDPRHPKLEFPPAALCPTCRISSTIHRHGGGNTTTEWNREEVIIFLRRFYGADFTIPDALPYTFVMRDQEAGRSRVVVTMPVSTSQPVKPRRLRPGPPLIPTTMTTPIPTTTNTRRTTTITTTTTPAPTSVTLPPEGAAGCHHRSSDWSPCSVTCGSGVSTRISNQNDECKLQIDSRICQVRPCDYRFVEARRDICGATYRGAQFSPLLYGQCRSVALRQWRYCGTCPGKCCHPIRSRTVNMAFLCGSDYRHRGVAFFDVHLIEFCECSNTCP